MSPQDGVFNYYREIVVADIDTSILAPANYTVKVQGMASAPGSLILPELTLKTHYR